MLDCEQLVDVEDKVHELLNDNLTGILATLNRQDKLQSFLSLISAEDLIQVVPRYENDKTGKIVILGQSQINEDQIRGIITVPLSRPLKQKLS